MLADKDVDEMINNTVMGKLLKGVRGEAAADLCGIKTALLSLAQMMLDYKEVSEVDLNPMIITEDNQLFAVDIRIKVK
jgi:succinyl-CoA synthetase beta subunit